MMQVLTWSNDYIEQTRETRTAHFKFKLAVQHLEKGAL